MRSLMGIINLGEPTDAIRELTQHRTLGAVPFGSRYRLIDFTLSNMVNAGIRNVGILIGSVWTLDPSKGKKFGFGAGWLFLLHQQFRTAL